VSREAYPLLARKRANQLIDELAITSFPVDPEAIAGAKGIPVETHDKFPHGRYGALVRQGDLFRIVVWAGCPTLGHRRFTIAHELGHYHLDGHVEALLASSSTAVSMGGNYTGRKDPLEVEADAFASELLMAERFARPVIAMLAPGLTGVRAIANQFVVSLSAAAIRLAMLTDEPVVVLLSMNGSMEWVSFSPSFRDHDWTRRRMRGECVPQDAATHSLASSPDRVVAGEEASASGVLSDWFDGAPATEVLEEALGLGPYGRVLTVLSCPTLQSAEDAAAEEHQSAAGCTGDWRDAL
jgi:hypothetical protein